MTAFASHPPFGRKATLMIAASLTVMAGATVAPSLPGLHEHFITTPNVDLLSRLVISLPAIFIAVAAPLVGAVIDRFGRRPMLIAGAILYGFAGMSGLLLDSLEGILAGRAALGIAVAAVMTTVKTLVGDYFQGADRERYMGVQSAFMGLGGVAFLAVGGALAAMHWRAPFALYGVALLMLPFIWIHLVEPVRPSAAALAAAGGDQPIPWRLIGALYLVSAVNMIGFYIVPTQVPFHLATLGVHDPVTTGLSIACGMLAASVSSYCYRYVHAYLGHAAIAALGFACGTLGMTLIAAAPSLPVALAGMAFSGLGMGTIMPNNWLWLMARVPARVRGRVFGGIGTCVFAGQFLSPLISQPIANRFGLAAAFGTVAVILAVVGLAFLARAIVDARR